MRSSATRVANGLWSGLTARGVVESRTFAAPLLSQAARLFSTQPNPSATATASASASFAGFTAAAAAPRAPLPPHSQPLSAARLPGWAAAAAASLAAAGGLAAATSAMADAPPAAPAVEVSASDPTTPRGMTDMSDIVLYQYEVCPFCNKVRAILDFYKVPYRTVEVDPLRKSELKWSEYKKVPVILIDGEQINDSGLIMRRVHNEMVEFKKKKEEAGGGKKRGGMWGGSTPKPPPGTLVEDKEGEEKWLDWIDKHWAIVVTINIYRTQKEALQTFQYISEHGNFSWWNRHVIKLGGAYIMFAVSHRKLKKKIGLEGDEREGMYRAGREWAEGLGGRPFMGGEAPGLTDIAMFGVCRAIRSMDAWRDLVSSVPPMASWYDRVEAEVGASSRRFDDDRYMTKKA